MKKTSPKNHYFHTNHNKTNENFYYFFCTKTLMDFHVIKIQRKFYFKIKILQTICQLRYSKIIKTSVYNSGRNYDQSKIRRNEKNELIPRILYERLLCLLRCLFFFLLFYLKKKCTNNSLNTKC